jgi:3-hydroxymyristoyl/3-hydroxydecanoyl-(acyl carrier protein) dehydratase
MATNHDTARLCDAIRKTKKRVVPRAAYFSGHFGVESTFAVFLNVRAALQTTS